MTKLSKALLIGAGTALLMAAASAAADEIRAVRVAGHGPLLDPEAAFWNDAPVVRVPMQPQMMTLPQHPSAAVDELTVRAAHNGEWLGVLVEWRDGSRDDLMRSDRFGDQVAVQLPAAGDTLPSPMMGHPGGPVNIMQWRAAFQRDLEHGEPTVRDLYPYALVDVYPDEVLRIVDARAYTGALGADNPVSRPIESPVLDQMAEGWGTLTVKPMQHADGRGTWQDGRWHVVITRPLTPMHAKDPQLLPGSATAAAFAVWEGGNREVGARKAWSAWVPLAIDE